MMMYLLDLGCVLLYTTHDSVVFDIGCDSLCRMYDNVRVSPGLCRIVYYA